MLECFVKSSYIYMGFDSCTTPIQQLYNNPSHEGEPQYVGPTLMWGVVVQLLYWCCKSNIFLYIIYRLAPDIIQDEQLEFRGRLDHFDDRNSIKPSFVPSYKKNLYPALKAEMHKM